MRLVLAAVLVLSLSSFSSLNNYSSCHKIIIADTSIIIHKTDGYANEWPASKFVTDSTNNVSYAIDNDRENLYIILETNSIGQQMRIMRMGMKLFIDLKEKKKENCGIEFPVKGETNSVQPDNSEEQSAGGRKDMNSMRISFKINDISMKLFGLEGQAAEQGLMMPNSAQVAFNWDKTNLLAIEYIIPLKFFHEDQNSLDKKEINIGWKLNGFERPSSSGTETTGNDNTETGGNRSRGNGSFSGRGGGGGYRGSRGGGSNSGRSFDREKSSQDQTIWTKFEFVF